MDPNAILAFATELLDEGRYDEAERILTEELARYESNPRAVAYVFGLSARLIDLGSEGNRLRALRRGRRAIESLKGSDLPEALCFYNLGTAHGVESRIKTRKHSPRGVRRRILAKDLLWSSYRLDPDNASGRLLTNLGQTLSETGRVVEALEWYDKAIEASPELFEPHLSKAIDLLWLYPLLHGPALLLGRVLILLHLARERSINEHQRQLVEVEFEKAIDLADSEGLNVERIVESAAHHDPRRSPYLESMDARLRRGLILNEHSLFCSCRLALEDNLHLQVYGSKESERLAVVELALGSTVPEYVALTDQFGSLDPDASLASIRTAFSGLDRIATAIAAFFEVATPEDRLGFVELWEGESAKKPTGKSYRRWRLLNAATNVPLLGLYSLATDLRWGGQFEQLRKT